MQVSTDIAGVYSVSILLPPPTWCGIRRSDLQNSDLLVIIGPTQRLASTPELTYLWWCLWGWWWIPNGQKHGFQMVRTGKLWLSIGGNLLSKVGDLIDPVTRQWDVELVKQILCSVYPRSLYRRMVWNISWHGVWWRTAGFWWNCLFCGVGSSTWVQVEAHQWDGSHRLKYDLGMYLEVKMP